MTYQYWTFHLWHTSGKQDVPRTKICPLPLIYFKLKPILYYTFKFRLLKKKDCNSLLLADKIFIPSNNENCMLKKYKNFYNIKHFKLYICGINRYFTKTDFWSILQIRVDSTDVLLCHKWCTTKNKNWNLIWLIFYF